MGVAVTRLDADAIALVMDNDIGVVAEALPSLQRFAELAGLTPRVTNRLEVVFEEVVTNPIRHGFTKGSKQSVRFAGQVQPDCLVLKFVDDGIPFNPLACAEPAPLTDLATAPEGGLGISLVRKLATSVEYEQGGLTEDGFQPVNRLTVTLPR